MSGILPRADGGGGSGGGSSLPVPPIPPSGATPSPLNVKATRSPTDGTTQTGQPLWMRKWSLSVGNIAGNQAYDLSPLSFEFDVTMQVGQTVWKPHIKIWNPPMGIVDQIGKLYTHVNLDVGYMPPSKQYGTVIQGQINYYRWGRQNATDTFLELYTAMHQTAFTAAVVNTWIPAGSTKDVVVDTVAKVLAPYGVTKGQITQMSQEKSPRGRALVGMARDILRDVARTEDAQWFIDQDGKLHMLRQSEILAMGNTEVPILSSKTGLVDVPTQVMKSGVEIHCLLNPAIRPGTRVRLDQEAAKLNAVANTEFFQTQFDAQSPLTAAIAKDGYYNVAQVKHWGQNRGNPWYSYIVTEAYYTVAPQTPNISAT